LGGLTDKNLLFIQKKVKEADLSEWNDFMRIPKTEDMISKLAPQHHKKWNMVFIIVSCIKMNNLMDKN